MGLEATRPSVPLNPTTPACEAGSLPDPTRLERRSSPKAAAKIWSRLHPQEYGLIKANGTINELVIEEIAKIVNWLRTGGEDAIAKAVITSAGSP
jgi:hypothetical protein